MEKIQEILFENQQTMPEGVYLQLMNALVPPSSEKKFYKLSYIVITPRMSVFKDEFGESEIGVMVRTSSVKEIIIRSSLIPDLQRRHKFEASPFKPFTYDSQEIFHYENEYKCARIKQSIRADGQKCNYDDDDFEISSDDEPDRRDIWTTLSYKAHPEYLIMAVEKI